MQKNEGLRFSNQGVYQVDKSKKQSDCIHHRIGRVIDNSGFAEKAAAFIFDRNGGKERITNASL